MSITQKWREYLLNLEVSYLVTEKVKKKKKKEQKEFYILVIAD